MLDLSKLKDKARPGLDEKSKAAKMGVLKDISDMASKSMGNDLASLKKVTVASPDNEGLKMGLHKAEELVDKAGMPLNPDAMEETDDSEDREEAVDHKEPETHHMMGAEMDHGDAHFDKPPGAKEVDEDEEHGFSEDELHQMLASLKAKKHKQVTK